MILGPCKETVACKIDLGVLFSLPSLCDSKRTSRADPQSMKMIMSALGKVMGSLEYRLSQTRWAHFTVSAALSRAIDPPSEAHCLEDFGTFGFARSPDGLMGITQDQCHHQEWEMERLSPSGSMQLMAVPKRKALKPAPVIIRCKSCGRVKLPHFFCCTGDKVNEERGDSAQ